MNARTLQINHPSELNSLVVSRLLRKARRGPIRLSPEFQHPQREQWEADLNRHYYACGCSSGAKGLLLMLLVGLGLGAAGYTFEVLSFGQSVATPLVGAVVGAAMGKLSGLAAARRRLTRAVHTVQANWKPVEKSERPIVICG
jgi:hypothetical protein